MRHLNALSSSRHLPLLLPLPRRTFPRLSRAALLLAVLALPAAPWPAGAIAQPLPQPVVQPPAPSSAATAPPAPVEAAPAMAVPGTGSATGGVASAVSTGPEALASLAWLQGCWAGKVNQREFTEQWTRPAGGMMLGLGQTVIDGRTSSFEFMRIELTAEGKVQYVARPAGKADEAFVFQGIRDDSGYKGHVFADPAREFPSEIMYTPTSDNQLFVYVKGKVGGEERSVVYPFRRLDCVTGKPL